MTISPGRHVSANRSLLGRLLGTWLLSGATHHYVLPPESVRPQLTADLEVTEGIGIWLVIAVPGIWALTDFAFGVSTDRQGDYRTIAAGPPGDGAWGAGVPGRQGAGTVGPCSLRDRPPASSGRPRRTRAAGSSRTACCRSSRAPFPVSLPIVANVFWTRDLARILGSPVVAGFVIQLTLGLSTEYSRVGRRPHSGHGGFPSHYRGQFWGVPRAAGD
jgi:hypothetical protein